MVALLRKKPAPDVDGFTSPERAALAHAIVVRDEAAAEVERAERAERLLNEALYARMAEVTEAEQAVREAGLPTAADLLAIAEGGDPAAGSAPAALAALARAEEAERLARANRVPMEGVVLRARNALEMGEMRVKQAVRAVIAAEAAGHAAKLAAELATMQRDAIATGATLYWLSNFDAVPKVQEYGHRHGRVEDNATLDALSRHVAACQHPMGWAEPLVDAARAPWDAALATLATDAAAPLPL